MRSVDKSASLLGWITLYRLSLDFIYKTGFLIEQIVLLDTKYSYLQTHSLVI